MSEYVVTDTELESVADAIRTKGGTQADLEFPSGFVTAIDNISGGGSATLISKTITQNGTYDAADDSADGYSDVTVNVSSGSSLIADWDFKSSLTDSINSLAATLTGATRDSNGVSITGATNAINFLNRIKANARTYEIKIGSMTLDSLANHHRFFMPVYNRGLIYRSTGYWSFYNGSWATDSTIASYDYFANSTMKIIIDINGYWHIYKDDTLVYEPNGAYMINDVSGNLMIGSTDGQSCTGVIIEGVKVY